MHGRYLIRLLSKQTDPAAQALGEAWHSFRLRSAWSAEVDNVLDIARQWIVLPGCIVSVQIDGATPIPVGYESPKAALIGALVNAGYSVNGDAVALPNGTLRVEEAQLNGISMAYLVEWAPYFQEWQFYKHLQAREGRDQDPIGQMVGLCVEGIQVDFEISRFYRSLYHSDCQL